MTSRVARPKGDSSGDGWTICVQGHRHWGLFGAAGLLIVDTDRVILQHRAPWTHQGGVWGIPGGARDSTESAVDAALREATEEAGLDPDDVIPFGLYLDDHGGWSYTTVVARPRLTLYPAAANAESVSVEWVEMAKVAELALHEGFAGAWTHLAELPETLHLVVSAELMDNPLLAEFERTGIAADRLPSGTQAGRLSSLIPTVHPTTGPGDVAEAISLYSSQGQVLLAQDESDLQLLV